MGEDRLIELISMEKQIKKDHRLKITFKYEDREFTSSISDSSTIGEVGEALIGLLSSAGYHRDNIDELFGLKEYEEYQTN